jgi:hypothetical protein
MCDLSEVLNAPRDNNEEKKRRRCTDGDAEGDQGGDKKNEEGEEHDNDNGEDGNGDSDVVGDISEQKTLSFGRTSDTTSCSWGADAATLIDAATAAAGMEETPFRHQLFTAGAAGIKKEEKKKRDLCTDCRETLVLQRYALYSARKKETHQFE